MHNEYRVLTKFTSGVSEKFIYCEECTTRIIVIESVIVDAVEMTAAANASSSTLLSTTPTLEWRRVNHDCVHSSRRVSRIEIVMGLLRELPHLLDILFREFHLQRTEILM